MRTLPLPELSEVQNELVRQAFLRLLHSGHPVPETQLNVATTAGHVDAHHELDALVAAGRVRRDDNSRVTGALGLTLETTRHRLLLAGRTWHTWCAIDALGILGALDASGSIYSTSPPDGRVIEIHFEQGRPARGDLSAVVYVPTYRPGASVVATWCPNVNFFESSSVAAVWASGAGVDGECLPLVAAGDLAATRWRERLTPSGSAITG
ncbi:organomercurial lyase [Micromonospora sp. NPDC051296]|uniref:organomercurial lyase n=1 Tax=Micromonospora sp. NPDC051296 TaxID=3155046 RepID=UPI00343C998C